MESSLHILSPFVPTAEDVVKVDENGQTILHIYISGVIRNRIRNMENIAVVIKSLCKMGASVIIEDNDGETPLGLALATKRIDLVEAMVQFSMDHVTNCNMQGDTILQVLLKKYSHNNIEDYTKFFSIVEEIMFKIAIANQENNNNELISVYVTAEYFLQEISRILQTEPLNIEPSSGDNLLMLTCKYLICRLESEVNSGWINWLLQQGLDVNLKNDCGFTALHYASQYYKFEPMLVLIEAGADVNALTPDGTNALHFATAHSNTEAVHYLIERGVAFDRRNIMHGAVLMHVVIRYTRDEDDAVKWLIDNGFDRSEEGELTLLHLAALMGHIKMVDILIDRGHDVRVKDKIFQYTPLHLASIRRQFATVPELREAGLHDGEVRYRNASFMTSMTHYGSWYSMDHFNVDYESTVLALLRAGADVHAKDRCGCTPLHYTARHNYENIFIALNKDENLLLALLLKAGACVDDLDLKGLSPLHYCFLSANADGLKQLLSFGADINDIQHTQQNVLKQISGHDSFAAEVRAYLIKLKVAGLPVNSLYEPYLYFEKRRYVDFFQEVDRLKQWKLTSNVSLYNWLHMDINPRFILIDRLTSNVEQEFLQYGSVIRNIHYQTTNRKPLIQPAELSYHVLTHWQWPDICVERVISFLDNRTLKVLISMCSTE